MASIADDIVLAVYMPPHAPAPGQALRTMSKRCSSEMRLAAMAPVHSHAPKPKLKTSQRLCPWHGGSRCSQLHPRKMSGFRR